LKEQWDVIHADQSSEQFIASVLEGGFAKQQAALIWYLGRRLNEPFLWRQSFGGRERRRTLSIDETYKKHLPGLTQARAFLRHHGLNDSSGIVTTNYDLLVEYALGSRGFNYGVLGEVLHGPGAHPMRQKPVVLSGSTPLAKLHGSLSWDLDRRYSDGRRALTGNALIVAPVPEKTPPTSLAAVWELARGILRAADRLVVFGFAFNPYDKAVLELLRRSGAHLQRVEVFDLLSREEQARQLWPLASVSCGPPPT
jgi:hypothetical protein